MRPCWLVTPWLGVFALACGSDPVKASAAPVVCDTPTYPDPGLEPSSVGKVVGTIRDADGNPVDGTPVMVCGLDVCTMGDQTDENGVGSVVTDSVIRKPAFKYGDGLLHAELAVLLSDPEHGATFPSLTLPALPADGSVIAPGATAESAGLRLTLARDASFTLDAFAPYDTEEHRAFRAAELPPDRFPDGLDQGSGIERVFTLAPLGAIICPPAKLTLPNSAGWDPGTPVDILIEGLLPDDEPYAPYGGWQPVGTGEVGASGAEIVMKTGGLPILSNVGVRRQ